MFFVIFCVLHSHNIIELVIARLCHVSKKKEPRIKDKILLMHENCKSAIKIYFLTNIKLEISILLKSINFNKNELLGI